MTLSASLVGGPFVLSARVFAAPQRGIWGRSRMDGVTTPATGNDAGASASTATPAVSTVNDAAAALAFADSSLATPDPAGETPAAAVTPPTESAPVSTSTADDPRSPYIPRARFDEQTTRAQKAEETLKRYDWAKDFTPEQLTDVAGIASGLRSDPVTAISQLLDRVLANPQLAPALQQRLAPLAGRMLAGQRRPAEPAAEAMPEPDLQSPDGTLVYSAPQMQKLRAWDERRLTESLTKRFDESVAPLKQVAQTFQQREAQAEFQTTSAQALDALKQQHPELEKHTAAIGTAIMADAQLRDLALGTAQTPPNPALAMEIAWARVYHQTVKPQQQSQTEAQVLTNLQQRAVAGAANPGAATTSTPTSTLGNARAALEHASAALGGR